MIADNSDQTLKTRLKELRGQGDVDKLWAVKEES